MGELTNALQGKLNSRKSHVKDPSEKQLDLFSSLSDREAAAPKIVFSKPEAPAARPEPEWVLPAGGPPPDVASEVRAVLSDSGPARPVEPLAEHALVMIGHARGVEGLFLGVLQPRREGQAYAGRVPRETRRHADGVLGVGLTGTVVGETEDMGDDGHAAPPSNTTSSSRLPLPNWVGHWIVSRLVAVTFAPASVATVDAPVVMFVAVT